MVEFLNVMFFCQINIVFEEISPSRIQISNFKKIVSYFHDKNNRKTFETKYQTQGKSKAKLIL